MGASANDIRYANLRALYGNIGSLNDLIYYNSITAPVGTDYQENLRGVTDAYLAANYPGMGKQDALYQFYLAGGSMGTSLPSTGNIVFNLKADSLALADGDAVTTWTDSTANALTFTGTAQFKTNQMNGKPCVRFAGTAGKYMTATRAGSALNTALQTQITTTMIIGKSVGTNSLGCMFGSNLGGNSYFMVIDGAQGSSAIGRYANDASTMVAPAVNAANMFVSASTSTIPYTAGSGTGLEQIYLNGSCVSSNVAPIPLPDQTTFSIGAVSNGALLAAFDAFDIIVWDKRLTHTEIFQATAYYYEKYNQTKPWAAVSKIVVYDGDSITAGVGAAGTVNTYPYKSAQSLSLSYGQWTNVAVGGITATNMYNKISEWSGIGALLGKSLRVGAFEYYNQRVLSAVQIEAANLAYANAVRAIASTKLAWGTSTSHSGDPDATRNSVNTYYDTNNASMSDAYVPIHNNTSIGSSTAYATNSATYWYDTVHLNGAGYTILAGLFTTGITALG